MIAARFFTTFLIALAGAAKLPAASAPVGRVSGAVRAADGAEIAGAQVRIEGPTLARLENSNIIQKVRPPGRYQLNVPPGSYELWATAPDFEDTKVTLTLADGETLTRDFALQPLARPPYRVETLALPRAMVGEVSGVAFTPRGTLAVTTRRGEVWMRAADGPRWWRFAAGLYEGFGLVAESESSVVVIQRPEFTRLRDTDGDGVADRFDTLADGWGITGSYHEFTYGLVRDGRGNFYAASGMAQFRNAGDFRWVRGPLKPDQFMPWTGSGPVPDGHRSVAQYQGWAFQVTPAGQQIPFAFGFRQPLGLGVSPDDELFISDCPGAWVPTATFTHVERDTFHGHPDGLKWHPELKDKKFTPAELTALRRPPSVYLPRGTLGTSPGQPVWDTTGGKFGPFAGQVFMGDVSSLIVRIDLEKVAGAWQGTVFPFLRGQGLRIGGMHNAFGPDGALYLGQTVRGWMSTEGNEGVQRIAWTGETPAELHTVRLAERGFALRFTTAMQAAPEVAVRRFRYLHHPLDGSLRTEEVAVPVTRAALSADGRALSLELLETQPGYVYELALAKSARTRDGRALLNPIAFYTLNRTLAGETQPGPTQLKVAAAAALQPGDVTRGAEVYRLNCLVCHQADGKGAKQVGTPDYTLAGGPLTKSDAELLAVITDGKAPTPPGVVPMPPWGNVLPAQSIRDVLAYLRATFQPAPPPR
ncbi:MAG: c-type cytochrome [Opitutaceae bacterium]|nr:c-type cytochrome [Opitutaceae bacterium]